MRSSPPPPSSFSCIGELDFVGRENDVRVDSGRTLCFFEEIGVRGRSTVNSSSSCSFPLLLVLFPSVFLVKYFEIISPSSPFPFLLSPFPFCISALTLKLILSNSTKSTSPTKIIFPSLMQSCNCSVDIFL